MTEPFIYLVGAGPGDPELITVKAQKLLQTADVIVYAGSLVSDDVLKLARADAKLHDSAVLTLEQMIDIIVPAAHAGKSVVRLASGDPSIFGTGGELTVALREAGIGIKIVPGVSSFLAAAAALGQELTVPEISQTVILTRTEGRTPMPGNESLAALAQSRALMVFFLSAALAEKIQAGLLEHYPPNTPIAIVVRASWPDEQLLRGRLDGLAALLKENKIKKTALIFVGEALRDKADRARTRSKLYNPEFSHGYRQASR